MGHLVRDPLPPSPRPNLARGGDGITWLGYPPVSSKQDLPRQDTLYPPPNDRITHTDENITFPRTTARDRKDLVYICTVKLDLITLNTNQQFYFRSG